MQNKQNIYSIFTLSILATFLLDFFTKKWAIGQNFREINIIADFFYIVPFSKNDGIAFGIDLPMSVQIGATLIIFYFLFRFGFEEIFKHKKWALFKSALLGMVIGGGLGNLVDRVTNSYVIDFIRLGPIPTFNIADVGITVGLGLLFVTIALSGNEQ